MTMDSIINILNYFLFDTNNKYKYILDFCNIYNIFNW